MTTLPTVAVRFRPPWEGIPEHAAWIANRPRLVDPISGATAQFQHLMSPCATTRDVYTRVIKELVQPMIKGINVTLLAIGQTGSGKSFTLHGGHQALGVISMLIEDLLECIQASKLEMSASLSFAEVRDEQVYDLLAETLSPVADWQTKNIEVPITVLRDCNMAIHRGNHKRHPTAHALIQINVKIERSSDVIHSTMNIFDLVDEKEEMNVVEAAFSDATPCSVLGRLVSDAFANAEIALLCCCAPEPRHYVETRATLDFALVAQRSALPIPTPNTLPSARKTSDSNISKKSSTKKISAVSCRPRVSQISLQTATDSETIRRLQDENEKLTDESEKKSNALSKLQQDLDRKNLEVCAMKAELSLKSSTITALTERLKSLVDATRTREIVSSLETDNLADKIPGESVGKTGSESSDKETETKSPGSRQPPYRDIRNPNEAFFRIEAPLEEQSTECSHNEDEPPQMLADSKPSEDVLRSCVQQVRSLTLNRPKVKVVIAPGRHGKAKQKSGETHLGSPMRGNSASSNTRSRVGSVSKCAKAKVTTTAITPRHPRSRTPREGHEADAPVGTLAKIRALAQARNERREQQEQVRRVKDELIAAGEDPDMIILKRQITRWLDEKNFSRDLPNWPPTKRIVVAVRKRPLCPNKEANCMDVVYGGMEPITGSVTVYCHEAQVGTQSLNKHMFLHCFPADVFFDESRSNEEIFMKIGTPIVDRVVNDGTYGTIFAYGQTGSGKTHTMSGTVAFESGGADKDEILGLVDLSAERLFDSIEEKKPGSTVMMSYIELYNGRLFDLLNERCEMKLLEDATGAMNIQGMSERQVSSRGDVHRFLARGSKLRRTEAMSQNDHSSRSHSVLSLTVVNELGEFAGRLAMVDLAGNERGVDNASASAKARRESAEINSSLLALKECIRSMACDRLFSPFRQSKLTLLLRDAFLCESAMTAMIACIKPTSTNYVLDTLRYAERAMQVERGGE